MKSQYYRWRDGRQLYAFSDIMGMISNHTAVLSSVRQRAIKCKKKKKSTLGCIKNEPASTIFLCP